MMTYAEYLAATRAQEQRDRNRFTGAGSHPGETPIAMPFALDLRERQAALMQLNDVVDTAQVLEVDGGLIEHLAYEWIRMDNIQ